MKAHKIEVLMVDHDDIGASEIKSLISESDYIYPSVLSIETVDIGEWDDDHPLNNRNTMKEECDRLFKK